MIKFPDKVVQKAGRDPHWRPIMFSRNTAMFTIPVDVRDAANLIDLHNNDLGAMVTYDKASGNIIIQPGVKKPQPVVVPQPEKKTKAKTKEAPAKTSEATVEAPAT